MRAWRSASATNLSESASASVESLVVTRCAAKRIVLPPPAVRRMSSERTRPAADYGVVVDAKDGDVPRHGNPGGGRGVERLPRTEVVRGEKGAGLRQRRKALGKGGFGSAGDVYAAEAALLQLSRESVAPCPAPFRLGFKPEPSEIAEVPRNEVVGGGSSLRFVVAEDRDDVLRIQAAARDEHVFNQHRRYSRDGYLAPSLVAVYVGDHAVGVVRGERSRIPRERAEVEGYLPVLACLFVRVCEYSVELQPLRAVESRHCHEYLAHARSCHKGNYTKKLWYNTPQS